MGLCSSSSHQQQTPAWALGHSGDGIDEHDDITNNNSSQKKRSGGGASRYAVSAFEDEEAENSENNVNGGGGGGRGGGFYTNIGDFEDGAGGGAGGGAAKKKPRRRRNKEEPKVEVADDLKDIMASMKNNSKKSNIMMNKVETMALPGVELGKFADGESTPEDDQIASYVGGALTQ